MSNETVEVKLIRSALWEIYNLQDKLAKKEPEGWEGSQRRLRLKEELSDYLREAEIDAQIEDDIRKF